MKEDFLVVGEELNKIGIIRVAVALVGLCYTIFKGKRK